MRRQLAVLTTALLLTACGSDNVPTEIVDQNQLISQQNAEMNAKQFRNQRYPEAERVMVDSDSTIAHDCRYGDGWASGKLVMGDSSMVDIKCQTNGRGKGYAGCLTKADFLTKEYASEEGSCNYNLTDLVKFK